MQSRDSLPNLDNGGLIRRRFRGCLLGLAVGDALGAPVEGMEAEEIGNRYGRLQEMVGGGPLDLAPGHYTDDTAMALCIARSLQSLGCFDPMDVAQRFLERMENGSPGLGRTTATALTIIKSGTPWYDASYLAYKSLGDSSASNGCIMRCAPVGLLHFRDPTRLVHDSIDSSVITHWDRRCRWATVAVNRAIARLVRRDRSATLFEAAIGLQEAQVSSAIMQVASLKLEHLVPSGYVLDTLQCALWCFTNTESFEEALVTAVNLGGDADTIGAVTGALAGAYYSERGIPERWLEPLQDRGDIETLADRLWEMA